MITIHKDLDAIASILYQTFEIPPFKRDYNAAFGENTVIVYCYGIKENPRYAKFFDSIPQDQWRTSDPSFIKQAEDFAITKFKEWIIEQVT